MRLELVLTLAGVGIAIAFFAGRISAPSPESAALAPASNPEPATPVSSPAKSGAQPPLDGRTELLRALARPAEDRAGAVRLAMLSWLGADGAAAIRQAREDPKLADQAGSMLRLALLAYPELFLKDPSLLDGPHGSERFIVPAAHALSFVEPDIAQRLIDLQFPESRHGGATVYFNKQRLGADDLPLTASDAYLEIDAALAETNFAERIGRVLEITMTLAATDPEAAAALVDGLPASSRRHVVAPLVAQWADSSPTDAAQWLANQSGQVAHQGMVQLGQHWGMRDFHAANAHLNTLTGAQRQGFLDGLAASTHARPSDETLTWIAGFEGSPEYPALLRAVVPGLAHNDVGAALSLIEALPESERQNSLMAIAPTLAMNDPEAATAVIEAVDDEQLRDRLLSVALPMWAQFEPESALDRALAMRPGQQRDEAIAPIAHQLAQFYPDRAIEAIEEIGNPEIRTTVVHMLISAIASDSDAFRLGEGYGLDRDTVQKLRAYASRHPMSFVSGPNIVIGTDVSISPTITAEGFLAPER